MACFDAFKKACPTSLCLSRQVDPATSYKYFLCGKGCVLGVLFENSINLYFEWVYENGAPVPYAPEVRYKFWPKHEVARLVEAGVWEVEGPWAHTAGHLMDESI